MSSSRTRRARPRTDRWWWVKVLLTMATGALALGIGPSVGVAGATHDVDQVGFYVMTDSNEPGGPSYAPVEAGHDLHLTPEAEGTVTLPFPFTFYGRTYTTASIGANGAIEFPHGQDVSPSDVALDQADNVMIAPWWDNWQPGHTGIGHVRTDTVGQAPHRTFVVWWAGVPNAAGLGTADFQAQLFEGSNRIEFHYLDVTHPLGDARGVNGTIGIDNGTTSALQYSHHQEVLYDGLAIRFLPATCAGRAVTRLGTAGDDVITTGPGNDIVLALGGNDHVRTGRGRDLVCTGAGADQVQAGRDDDRVDLGGGDDVAHGGQGRDRLLGGAGRDRLEGGLGRDTCRGGPDRDVGLGCEVRRSIP